MCCSCEREPEDDNTMDVGRADFLASLDDAREENREWETQQRQGFDYLGFAIENARREFTPEYYPEMFTDDDEGIAA